MNGKLLIAMVIVALSLGAMVRSESSEERPAKRHANYLVGQGFERGGLYDLSKEKSESTTLVGAVLAAKISLKAEKIEIVHYRLVGSAAEKMKETYLLDDVLKKAVGKTPVRPGDVLEAIIAPDSPRLSL